MATLPKLETTTPAIDPRDLLTVEELAKLLKVRVSWVHEQTRARSTIRNKHPLPCIKMRKYLRFHWPTVSKWLLENKD
jgi:hypothetical protein